MSHLPNDATAPPQASGPRQDVDALHPLAIVTKAPPSEPNPASDSVPRADVSRRRLLQGGLGGVPVLVTLFSRPVLGQTPCLTASAFLSGNASSPGREFLPRCPTVDPTLIDPN